MSGNNFSSKFSDIILDGDTIKCKFHPEQSSTTNDMFREVNVLRHSILTQVKTYAIAYVVLHSKMDAIPLPDELFSHRLGLIPIDGEMLEGMPNIGGEWKFRIDTGVVKSLYNFTTDDMPQVPFIGTTPIVYIPKGNRLIFDIIIKEGIGYDHVKYRPVYHFTYKKENDGFELKMKTYGKLSHERILRNGYAGMNIVKTRAPENIYFDLQKND